LPGRQEVTGSTPVFSTVKNLNYLIIKMLRFYLFYKMYGYCTARLF
jgi:hypothetical protein